MMSKFKTLIAIGMMAFSFSQAQAGVINIGANGLKDATHSENFDFGKMGDNVSNQFSANGLNFDTWGKSGINLTNTTMRKDTVGGVSNQYLIMGMSSQCAKENKKVSMVSVMFDENVSELSWLGFNRAVGKGFTIQALYNDMIVAELDFTNKNNFENEYVNINGSIFNELRFMENGNWQGYFGIDNMSWVVTDAVPNGEVPLPGSVALLGIGLLGLSFVRRKSNKA